MDAICLSLAPNLRCQNLTFPESIGLIISPVLEVVFCIGLLAIKRGGGLRKGYLLSAEGFVYFFLALLDLLSHHLLDITGSLSHFKALDIFIGISSTIPLVFYLSFLFFLTSKDFVPNLPLRIQLVTKYALLCMVPTILVFNLLGSFATLTYRFIHVAPNAHIIGVKYTEATLELFFNSLTLVLLVIFQALNFCACFYRLVQALVDQRRIDVTANGNDHERHLFNGTGWISAGIKLGAIESIIGFASGDFGLTLTRRILRFLGRACLIIGVVKGLDAVEDFQFVKRSSKARQVRRSALMTLISSPNPATFHQIGGYGYEPSIEPPAAVRRSRTITLRSPLPFSPAPLTTRHAGTPRQSFLTPSQMIASPSKSVSSVTPSPSPYTAEFVQPPAPALTLDTRNISPRKSQRVVVRYRHGRAPTLDFNRFSDLGLPSAEARERYGALGEGQSSGLKSSALPLEDGYSDPFATFTSQTTRTFEFPPTNVPSQPRSRHTIGDLRSKHQKEEGKLAREASRKSTQTYVSRTATLEVLHALAMEYPGVHPDAASAGIPRNTAPSIADSATFVEGGALSRSTSERTINSNMGLVRRGSSVKRKPVPKYDEESLPDHEIMAIAPVEEVVEETQAATEPEGAPERTVLRLPSNPRPKGRPRPKRATTHPMPNIEPPAAAVTNDRMSERAVELEEAFRQEPPTARIKSIGSAPRRWTPTPSQVESVRESIVAEWHDTRDGDQVVYPTPPGSAAFAV